MNLLDMKKCDVISTCVLTPLDDSVLASQDCIAVLVAHRCIDYGRVGRLAPLIVDTVNSIPRVESLDGKVVRLGVGATERMGSPRAPGVSR